MEDGRGKRRLSQPTVPRFEKISRPKYGREDWDVGEACHGNQRAQDAVVLRALPHRFAGRHPGKRSENGRVDEVATLRKEGCEGGTWELKPSGPARCYAVQGVLAQPR